MNTGTGTWYQVPWETESIVVPDINLDILPGTWYRTNEKPNLSLVVPDIDVDILQGPTLIRAESKGVSQR